MTLKLRGLLGVDSDMVLSLGIGLKTGLGFGDAGDFGDGLCRAVGEELVDRFDRGLRALANLAKPGTRPRLGVDGARRVDDLPMLFRERDAQARGELGGLDRLDLARVATGLVDRLVEIETMEEDGTMAMLPKKEQLQLRKEMAKRKNQAEFAKALEPVTARSVWDRIGMWTIVAVVLIAIAYFFGGVAKINSDWLRITVMGAFLAFLVFVVFFYDAGGGPLDTGIAVNRPAPSLSQIWLRSTTSTSPVSVVPTMTRSPQVNALFGKCFCNLLGLHPTGTDCLNRALRKTLA